MRPRGGSPRRAIPLLRGRARAWPVLAPEGQALAQPIARPLQPAVDSRHARAEQLRGLARRERCVEALERQDFAALAALVREGAWFSFPPRPFWYDGLEAFRRGSEKHAAPGEHLFVAARANLQPAVAIYLRAPGEARYRPLALEVLCVEEGRVVEAVDWSRPEPFMTFGLPMSFPASRRSNKDEFKSKEGPMKVRTEQDWQTARKELLVAERELEEHAKRVEQQRRELPWVPVEKEYRFRDRGRAEVAARAVRGALAAAHLPPDVRRGLGGCMPGLLLARRRTRRRCRESE